MRTEITYDISQGMYRVQIDDSTYWVYDRDEAEDLVREAREDV